MNHSFAKSLRILAVLFALANACCAEQGILVVQVNDIQNRPVAGIEISAKGFSESGITGRKGLARLKVDLSAKVNDWVVLQIIKNPQSKDFVLISPWDSRTQIPPFDNETTNFVGVVVANRGDRAMLENGAALAAIVAKINKTNSPKPKEIDPEQQGREALKTIATAFGLTPKDLDKAIRAWGEKTEDPYEKGLAALYGKNYSLASQRLAESFEQRKKDLAKAQVAAADAAFFLGESKYEAGKYRESAAAYQEAQDLHPDVPVVLNNLALSLTAAGDYAGVEPLYRRALVIDEKTLGPDHPEVGTTLNNLASLLRAKGDYAGAEPLFRQALAIAQKSANPNDPDVGRRLNNLAGLLQAKGKGDYTEAELLYRRSLEIEEKALGSDHPDVGTVLNNLAGLLQAKGKGDYTEAELLFRRSLAIAEKALGPDHPSVGGVLNNLAALLKARQDLAGAEPLYRRSLTIDENALGTDHLEVGKVLNNLAGLLQAKKDYAGAEPLYRRSLAIFEKTLGPDHLDSATVRSNLKQFLEEKEKAEQAKRK